MIYKIIPENKKSPGSECLGIQGECDSSKGHSCIDNNGTKTCSYLKFLFKYTQSTPFLLIKIILFF